ncbi:MAG: hypothetical protein DMG69_21465 [Acidobacteria bacterium]|nr:MAG: hypothetical protein DMG69_21465 [Acidobacteriota bacterium]
MKLLERFWRWSASRMGGISGRGCTQVSKTGGLLSLSKPLEESTKIEVIFHAGSTTVRSPAPLLFPSEQLRDIFNLSVSQIWQAKSAKSWNAI